jgi:hypothetical protein
MLHFYPTRSTPECMNYNNCSHPTMTVHLSSLVDRGYNFLGGVSHELVKITLASYERIYYYTYILYIIVRMHACQSGSRPLLMSFCI